MPEAVFILTGPIQSGKTTALQRWYIAKSVAGVLSPVINQRRIFVNIASGESFPMLASETEDALEVGRFRFSKASFEVASSILAKAINSTEWLIVDEIGPLELQGNGFNMILRRILSEATHQKLILVIRSHLVDEVMHLFNLREVNPKIITIESLASI